MAYQIILSDDEYAALSALAAQRGQQIETLVHEALAERYAVPSSPRGIKQVDPLVDYMLRMGHIREMPTGEDDTSEERVKRQQLAASVGPGTLASDLAMEDRGPR